MSQGLEEEKTTIEVDHGNSRRSHRWQDSSSWSSLTTSPVLAVAPLDFSSCSLQRQPADNNDTSHY